MPEEILLFFDKFLLKSLVRIEKLYTFAQKIIIVKQ